jgi:hypothetical protein
MALTQPILSVQSADNRSGEDEHPYGFVYFTDGKRLAYAGTRAYYGTGGWEAVTPTHVAMAREYLNANALLKAYEFGSEIVSNTEHLPGRPVVYHAKDASDPEPWVSFDGELFRHDQVAVKPLHTMCDNCGTRKPDVRNIPDPADRTAADEDWMRDLCEACASMREALTRN